ncbi:hypothetical protein QGN29_12915 [Temperatibacter marinus]|uniref:Uncharacterized protein n=1 Tax=Temperatibacter marinus TaxID=1456591 RepID=A0AA52EBS3_9PROT|nr:hypothetical protein [Temperatibacter marinus]WND02447.1 hypothetical protein QGN29_12915 [Temperatibacter marinus]
MSRILYILITLTLLCLAQPLQADDPMKPAKESAAIKEAKRLAKIGGTAIYCKEEPEIMNEFVDKARTHLLMLAKDKYDRVFATVDFKNLMTAFSVKKPDVKCEQTILDLKKFLRK